MVSTRVAARGCGPGGGMGFEVVAVAVARRLRRARARGSGLCVILKMLMVSTGSDDGVQGWLFRVSRAF